MLNITFNYDFDTEGFFSGTDGATRRATLEQAASFYENFITDNLLAIPTGSVVNTWTAFFANPATGNQQSILDLTVAANSIIVYAGGRDLPSAIGQGGPGGYTASGSSDFLELIKGRGQAGALTEPATDYSLWGGSITFDTNIVLGSTNVIVLTQILIYLMLLLRKELPSPFMVLGQEKQPPSLVSKIL